MNPDSLSFWSESKLWCWSTCVSNQTLLEWDFIGILDSYSYWLLTQKVTWWGKLTVPGLAFFRIHGLSRIVRMLRRRMLNGSSEVNLRCARDLSTQTHFEATIMNQDQFNQFLGHLGIMAQCHESRLDWSRTADWAIPFGNKVSQGNIEWRCQNLRHRLSDSCQSHSFGRHVIEDQVHQRIIGIWFESHYDGSITAYLPIKCGQETV